LQRAKLSLCKCYLMKHTILLTNFSLILLHFKDISDIRTAGEPLELVHTLFCSSKYLSL